MYSANSRRRIGAFSFMATYRYIEFADAMPLKFVEKDKVIDPQYNSLPMTSAQFWDRIYMMPGMPRRRYCQKWEQADTWFAQWSAETTLGSTIDLYSCDGTNMLLPNTGQHTTIAGNLAPNGNALRTEHFTGNFADIPAGVYYLVITVNYNDTPNFAKQYISEPLHIAPKHSKTLAITYTNSYNKEGIFFEQFPCYPRIRLNARVFDFIPGSNDTQYEAETTEMTLLSSDPFRMWMLQTGAIPDWLADKLNRILTMDEWYADETRYTKDKEAKFNVLRADNYPMAGYAIQVRPQGEDGITRFTTPILPPPYVCPVLNVPFTILPAPVFNTFANNNLYGADRSILRMVVDPDAVGVTMPYVISNWDIAAATHPWITPISGTIPGMPYHLFDDAALDNYYQRQDTSIEDGHTTAYGKVKIVDPNGCIYAPDLGIDFSIVTPGGWIANSESVLHCGQSLLGYWADMVVNMVTNNSATVSIVTPSSEPGATYSFCLDSTFWTIDGNTLPGHTFTGLAANTIYAAFAAVKVGGVNSQMGPIYFKTAP